MSPLIDAAGRPLKGAKSDAQPTNAGSGAAPAPASPSAGTHVKESSLQTFAADVKYAPLPADLATKALAQLDSVVLPA